MCYFPLYPSLAQSYMALNLTTVDGSAASETCKAENSTSKTPPTIKEIISTLPTEKGWKVFQQLCFYQGFWRFPLHLEGSIFAQRHFKATPSDVLLCSAPKTGTTWLKAFSVAIFTRNSVGDESMNSLFFNKVPHECIMFLEKYFIKNPSVQSDEKRLPLVATHLTYTALPKSILDSGCKMVYICRDPKDAFVSLWHSAMGIKANNNPDLPIDVALEFRENPENFFFMRYENLQTDTISEVKKLAEFLGHPFSSEEEKQGSVEKVISLCSLQNLSSLEINKTVKYGDGERSINNDVYFRKGKISYWKNHLTPEMGKKLDDIMEEKLSGSGFTFLQPN
ncbi:Sulfotransferase 17 [Hibiscus syriacus]|uniref:Sulfotransferase n=1 Tax=Hibiscus syriacus TaxID=106335 RepID=A0A6A2XND0_HIBSY|nr:Sulfotransferase 17 [Hibiscus syriacus]